MNFMSFGNTLVNMDRVAFIIRDCERCCSIIHFSANGADNIIVAASFDDIRTKLAERQALEHRREDI